MRGGELNILTVMLLSDNVDNYGWPLTFPTFLWYQFTLGFNRSQVIYLLICINISVLTLKLYNPGGVSTFPDRFEAALISRYDGLLSGGLWFGQCTFSMTRIHKRACDINTVWGYEDTRVSQSWCTQCYYWPPTILAVFRPHNSL